MSDYIVKLFSLKYLTIKPIPVAARSKAWVCIHLIAGIAGSNLAESMDVRLLCLLFGV